MLFSKDNQKDLATLKQDLKFADSKSSCIRLGKEIEKQIKSFHVDENIKHDLLNYYHGFTAYDAGNKKEHISNAQCMIAKLVNTYVDDLLGLKKEDEFTA